jgi:peroxidase
MMRMLQGCDASIMIMNSNGDDEWRNSDNQSLKREGFTTILSAKAAVDSDPQCRNKVSCADILALAARESVLQVPTTSMSRRAASSHN